MRNSYRWSSRARIGALAIFILLLTTRYTISANRQKHGQFATARTIKTFIEGAGDWSNPLNWSPPGVPLDGDHVIIPDNGLCHVRVLDAVADSFEVQFGGVLLIHGLLTIDRDSSVEDFGGVRLARDLPTDLPTLVIDGDIVLSGTGSIRGEYHLARIIISHGSQLVNETHISGEMRIVGLPVLSLLDLGSRGSLLNGGIIQANGGGTFAVESSIRLVNHPTPGEWIVNVPDALLYIATGAANLNDNFTILSGELQMDEPIISSGNLTLENGCLDINADLTLHHPDYPKSKSLFRFDGGSGIVACEVTFSYDDFAGTRENPDNTKDEDPPYEVVGPPCGAS